MVRDDYCERNKNSTERERDQKESVLKERKRETQRKKARKSPHHHGEEIFKNHTHPGMMMRFAR